jgi:uncharacterized protein (TIGR02757 family)
MLDVKALLEEKYWQYNQLNFIENDPISIPHIFSKKQDIEIMGFWTAILSWGLRKTIIQKSKELIQRMDGVPYEFVMNHTPKEAEKLVGFKHRTFNDTDALYFLYFFQNYYRKHQSLELAFVDGQIQPKVDMEICLGSFQKMFFESEYVPARTKKHISSPLTNSACKRLNMFLRWMVRKDAQGVDFGIWQNILPSQLICPCDVHVERVARKLKLITIKGANWKSAQELTANLRLLDASDPVKYDFALFGLGVEKFF